MKVTLRQLPPNTIGQDMDYRPLLKEVFTFLPFLPFLTFPNSLGHVRNIYWWQVKKSEETRIVLDCDFDKIEMILQQVQLCLLRMNPELLFPGV